MARIEALSREHDRQSFDCGVPKLNAFLRQQARQAQDKGLSRTFVALDDVSGSPARIVGYFTLAAAEILTQDLPPELARKFPRKIPAVVLARLAVDRREQGKGLGGALLVEALQRIARSSDQLGIAGALVDAKDEGAAAFYRHFGFAPFPSEPLRLFLPLASVKALM